MRAHFEAERVQGTIALYDSLTGRLVCSDVKACERPVAPASTFKIANALIALETGVLEDGESAMPWDGKHYAIEDWNQDHTLRTGMRTSCVPCFQAVARAIGDERMRDWLKRLDYGNHDTSGGIEWFWLGRGLAISPIQQIDFLRRLDGAKLPVSARSLETVRDVLTLDVGSEHVLRGKTGALMPPEIKGVIGWFVGWVELGDRRVFFATLIDGIAPDVELMPVRRRLTERILRAEGVLPE